MNFYQDFTLNVLDVDFKGRAKWSTILNFFQEVATNDFACSHAELLRNNQFWVITRISFAVNRLPRRLETVRVETWQNKPRLIDVDRDYRMLGADGEVLVLGSSRWCILNATTHKVLRISDCACPSFPVEEALRALPDANQKIPPVSAQAEALPVIAAAPGDLDLNYHVNNAKYADYLFNLFTVEELDRDLKSLSINFVKETRAGEVLHPFRESADAYRLELRTADGQTKIRAEAVL